MLKFLITFSCTFFLTIFLFLEKPISIKICLSYFLSGKNLYRIIGNVCQKQDLQILKNYRLTAILSSKKIFSEILWIFVRRTNFVTAQPIFKICTFLTSESSFYDSLMSLSQSQSPQKTCEIVSNYYDLLVTLRY